MHGEIGIVVNESVYHQHPHHQPRSHANRRKAKTTQPIRNNGKEKDAGISSSSCSSSSAMAIISDVIADSRWSKDFVNEDAAHEVTSHSRPPVSSKTGSSAGGTSGHKRKAASPLKQATQPKQMYGGGGGGPVVVVGGGMKLSRKGMFEAFQPWVLQTYGDSAKTKTITKKKYSRIVKTLRGEEINNAENSKFRFWVKAKGKFFTASLSHYYYIVQNLQPERGSRCVASHNGKGKLARQRLYTSREPKTSFILLYFYSSSFQ
jgi:hypothetical protein